jgi:hypothetical protein
MNGLQQDFLNLTARVAQCPHVVTCRRECEYIRTVEPPIPDFFGRNYRGFVIIASIPGTSKTAKEQTKANDVERAFLTDEFGKRPTFDNYASLMDHGERFMRNWDDERMLVRSHWRRKLGYNIENVAFINLIKCRSTTAESNVEKPAFKTVADRCWQEHTAQQLEALRPRYIAAQYKDVFDILVLRRLIPNEAIQVGWFNGARRRDLTDETRIENCKDVFARFAHEVAEG